jgi:hypothetical protein
MSSQKDLDQGGTSRAWTRQYMGPSVGWVWVPAQNILPITAAGTYTLDPSTSLVTINIAGVVVVILPSAIVPVVPAGVQPGLYAQNPITIVDIGGLAFANPVTIKPASVLENVMGLNQITLGTNYGGYTLSPNSIQKGWTSISP